MNQQSASIQFVGVTSRAFFSRVFGLFLINFFFVFFMYFEEKTPIVVDSGSGVTKAGFSGEESPRWVFPSVVGFPENVAALEEVSASPSFLSLSLPLSPTSPHPVVIHSFIISCHPFCADIIFFFAVSPHTCRCFFVFFFFFLRLLDYETGMQARRPLIWLIN